MSHPALEQFLAQLADAWAGALERDDRLAELRDHIYSVYEALLDSGVDDAAAVEAALAECGDANQLTNCFRDKSFSRRARWMMRLTTAALVAGILTASSVAIWWPGEQTPAVAIALAQPALAQPAKARGDVVVVGDATEANNTATQQKLAKYVQAEFFEVPLAEVLGYIADQAEIETYANERLLKEAIGEEATVTIRLKKVRADMLLDLALQQVGGGSVDYVIRDGIVVVTTVESLDGASEVKAYPVADLLALHGPREAAAPMGIAPPGGPGSAPGGFEGGGFGVPGGGGFAGRMPDSVEQLITVISSTVAPDSWEARGGFGTITYYGDMLIVRQNARTHREVEKLLKLLRATAAKK